jgi:predicted DsbA family dithiol-disulfide isomerase
MEVEVAWLPFELRPEPVELPPPDEARTRAYWSRSVFPLAERLGVEIHPPQARPRTRLAHEAFAFARAAGRADAMAEGLFRAHFVEGRDLGEIGTLAAIGAAAGLDGAALRSALQARTHAREVEEGLQFAADLGVTAVPTFLIGRYAIPGLVGVQTLRRAVAAAAGEG